MAGYDWTKGMSNNAVNAYENGEKPLSKWTKSEILETISELGWNADLFKGFKVSDLKEVLLEESSWHHTSKFFNETSFYQISPYMFEEKALAELKGENYIDEGEWCDDAFLTYNGEFCSWKRRISKDTILIELGNILHKEIKIVKISEVKKYENQN